MNASTHKAVFLDRDGVLIEDTDLLTEEAKLRVLAGVPEALITLRQAGFLLMVISNQPVVARGLITEAGVEQIHRALDARLQSAGAGIDRYYFCPHHPKATLPQYRMNCECRKPQPGMLLRAAQECGIDLAQSFCVGDRLTDIVAGAKAGCRTVLVQTGRHLDPLIESAAPVDLSIKPDWTCANLKEAAAWILK